jgi:hypothetical protein
MHYINARLHLLTGTEVQRQSRSQLAQEAKQPWTSRQSRFPPRFTGGCRLFVDPTECTVQPRQDTRLGAYVNAAMSTGSQMQSMSPLCTQAE